MKTKEQRQQQKQLRKASRALEEYGNAYMRMNNMQSINTTPAQNKGGSSFLSLLFLVFLVLKLTKVITWSWWWVTAPLWGPVALFALAMAAGLLFVLVAHLVSRK